MILDSLDSNLFSELQGEPEIYNALQDILKLIADDPWISLTAEEAEECALQVHDKTIEDVDYVWTDETGEHYVSPSLKDFSNTLTRLEHKFKIWHSQRLRNQTYKEIGSSKRVREININT